MFNSKEVGLEFGWKVWCLRGLCIGKGKAEEAVKELDFARTSIYRPGLLITDREESRRLDKAAQRVVGFLDRSSKASIKTEDLAKAMVFNATKKNIESKIETLEHAEILKVSKEALESSTVSLLLDKWCDEIVKAL